MNTGVSLRQLEERLNSKSLEIAIIVQHLTYGDMMELAEAMWKCRPDESAITLENLPALLHRWSKSHSVAVPGAALE